MKRFLLTLLLCLGAISAHAQSYQVVPTCGGVNLSAGNTAGYMDAHGNICMSGSGSSSSSGVTITNPVDAAGNVKTSVVPTVEPSTNISGAVTTAATWQQISVTAGKRFAFQNPCSATTEGIATAESIFVQFSTTAPTGTNAAWEIPSCAIFDSGTSLIVSDPQPIWVYAATAGHVFVAKEWP